MTHPRAATGFTGVVMTWVGAAGAAVNSIFGGLTAQTPDASINAATGLKVSVALAVIGLLTQVVNGVFAGRKLRKDVTDRMEAAELRAIEVEAKSKRDAADALATAERKVADALATAERKIADAKAESDRVLARLRMDAEAAADRRKAEREFSVKQMLALKDEMDRLTRADRRMEPKVDRNTVSADILSAGTNIPIPPLPPEPEDDPEPEPPSP